MSALWDELSEGEDNGFLMIDADNGFNAYSRIRMLWTIRHLWPAGARFAFNCYKFQSMLIVRDPGGLNYLILYSREGVTQGDPLSMFCYAIGTLPLIRKLKAMRPDRPHQSWYADDASAIGNFEALHSLFTDLASIGPSFRYLPNASKSILVVPEHRVAAAEDFFNRVHRYNISICTGSRYLGGFIGSEQSRDEYVSSKVSDWEMGVERFAMVATKNQTHAAYTGFTKSFQHE